MPGGRRPSRRRRVLVLVLAVGAGQHRTGGLVLWHRETLRQWRQWRRASEAAGHVLALIEAGILFHGGRSELAHSEAH